MKQGSQLIMMLRFIEIVPYVAIIVCGMNTFLVGGVVDDRPLSWDKDVLRGLNFKVYAYQVNTITM